MTATHEKRWHGSCECKNITLSLRTLTPVDKLWVRICGCSFCAKHGARNVADPKGDLTIEVARRENLIRYRMGHKTADFLICKTCGVYVGTDMDIGEKHLSIININTLENADQLPPAGSINVEGQTVEERIAGRRERWMPSKIVTKG